MLVVHRADAADLGLAVERRCRVVARGRRSVMPDLKTAQGVSSALKLVKRADVLIEGLRPGVMERLGLSPAVCLEHRPQLVYGRMTGWGQTGPLRHHAGHDINYIADTGALNAIRHGAAGQCPHSTRWVTLVVEERSWRLVLPARYLNTVCPSRGRWWMQRW